MKQSIEKSSAFWLLFFINTSVENELWTWGNNGRVFPSIKTVYILVIWSSWSLCSSGSKMSKSMQRELDSVGKSDQSTEYSVVSRVA